MGSFEVNDENQDILKYVPESGLYYLLVLPKDNEKELNKSKEQIALNAIRYEAQGVQLTLVTPSHL